jgi:hypothetical protein
MRIEAVRKLCGPVRAYRTSRAKCLKKLVGVE